MLWSWNRYSVIAAPLNVSRAEFPCISLSVSLGSESQRTARSECSFTAWLTIQIVPQHELVCPISIRRTVRTYSWARPLFTPDISPLPRSNEEEAYFALGRWERYASRLDGISAVYQYSTHCRLLGFGACLVGSAVCFTVAFFTLPLIAMRPGKFALAFRCEKFLRSSCVHISIPLQPRKPSCHVWVSILQVQSWFIYLFFLQLCCSLWPHKSPQTSCLSRKITFLRSIPGISWTHSLFFNWGRWLLFDPMLRRSVPYCSLQRKSYFGSLIFAIVQILALVAYVGAYFPGGWATMRFGGQMALRGAGNVLPF